MPELKKALAAAAGASIMALAFSAAAQDYPSKPVEVIIPFSAGGGADASQRVFNKYAEPLVGRTLVALNRPGAGGTTGWAELVRAKPDGYTLAIVTPPFNVIPAVVKPKETGYTLDQFTNICVYAVMPDVLLVRNDAPYQTFAAFAEHAKANPGKIKVANSGALGADFMTTLLIENAIGADLVEVPFNGGSKALQGTLAGTTDALVASPIYAVSQADQMTTLAVTSPQRFDAVPDVPTFTELGYQVVAERFRALAGPPNLPKKVVDYWANICKQVTSDLDFRAEMEKLGQPVAFRGPDEAQKAIDAMSKDIQAIAERNKLIE